MVFPLTQQPDVGISEKREDNSLKSTMQTGSQQARPHYTATRKTYTLTYSHLTQAEKDLLDQFEATVGCYTVFSWNHPRGGTFQVRFAAPVDYRLTSGSYWVASFQLVEHK